MSNRIFKFRAWDGTKMNYDFIIDRPQFTNLLSILTDEKFVIENYNSVIEWKVMQFTGLYDKDGREIWEGDILFDENSDEYCEVRWDTHLLQYTFFYSLEKYWDSPYDHLDSCSRCELSVVGNIYENSELLKMDNFKKFSLQDEEKRTITDVSTRVYSDFDISKSFKFMTKEELTEKIIDWEYEAGESFADCCLDSILDAKDWAKWLIDKGYEEVGKEILEECDKSPYGRCTDLSLKFDIFPVYDRGIYLEENVLKNYHLLCEYILENPELLSKTLECFEQNEY